MNTFNQRVIAVIMVSVLAVAYIQLFRASLKPKLVNAKSDNFIPIYSPSQVPEFPNGKRSAEEQHSIKNTGYKENAFRL